MIIQTLASVRLFPPAVFLKMERFYDRDKTTPHHSISPMIGRIYFSNEDPIGTTHLHRWRVVDLNT